MCGLESSSKDKVLTGVLTEGQAMGRALPCKQAGPRGPAITTLLQGGDQPGRGIQVGPRTLSPTQGQRRKRGGAMRTKVRRRDRPLAHRTLLSP